MPSSILTTNFLVLFVLVTRPLVASAQAPDAVPGGHANEEEARRAFDEGQALYRQGLYDEAIARFRQAQELRPSPMLHFNIAQAYRQKGDCAQALDAYQAFLREEPAARDRLRSIARGHVAELEKRCPPAAAVPAVDVPRAEEKPSPKPAPPPVTAPAPTLPPHSAARAPVETRAPVAPERSSIMVPTLLATGAALAATSIVAAIWSSHEEDAWAKEDALLLKGGDMLTPQAAIERQNANDERLRKIETLDAVTVVAGVAGAAALIGAGAWWLTHRARVTPRPEGGVDVSLAATF